MHRITIVFALSIAVLAGLFLGSNNEAIASSDQIYSSAKTTVFIQHRQ